MQGDEHCLACRKFAAWCEYKCCNIIQFPKITDYFVRFHFEGLMTKTCKITIISSFLNSALYWELETSASCLLYISLGIVNLVG